MNSYILRCIKNIFLPNTCLACESIVESYGLCSTCIKSLRMSHKPSCKFCGRHVSYNLDDHPCQKCMNKTRYISEFHSVFEYNDIMRTLIMKFKNCADFRIQKWMANMMSISVQNIEFDYIVPVPMHWSRQINRGYNQSAVLATNIANNLGCNYRLDFLYKNCVQRQANLNKQERINNILGTFDTHNMNIKDINHKSILLVDDIKTTGATLEECAKVLLSAGASSVTAVVLAMVPF